MDAGKAALPPLIIGDLVFEIPVVQGGMGVLISDGDLVSSVASAGGAATFAAVGVGLALYPEEAAQDYPGTNARALREQLREIRSRTSAPVGVNIMMALTDRAELMAAACAEDVDFIVFGAGLPLDLPECVTQSRAKLICIVSSHLFVGKICRTWLRRGYERIPDAFIVEGPSAGGHLGISWKRLSNPKLLAAHELDHLVPRVVAAVREWEEVKGKPIPVIAAGGLFDGSDIAQCLRLGASGVQLGSRFVCTEECAVSPVFKDAYIRANEDDIALITSPVGMPIRVIKNAFYRRVEAGEKIPLNCPYWCLETCDQETVQYCIASALVAARNGDMENGIVTCSAVVPRITEITSVRELLGSLVEETEWHLRRGE